MVSIVSWKIRPSTMIGIEPMMISHPIRYCGSLRGTRTVPSARFVRSSPSTKWDTIWTMSRQK